MKNWHWSLLIGYLVGSFFGLMNVIGFVTGLLGGGKKSAPAAA